MNRGIGGVVANRFDPHHEIGVNGRKGWFSDIDRAMNRGVPVSPFGQSLYVMRSDERGLVSGEQVGFLFSQGLDDFASFLI